jgi:hypothetical protein
VGLSAGMKRHKKKHKKLESNKRGLTIESWLQTFDAGTHTHAISIKALKLPIQQLGRLQQ